jgi:hypothetical protein
MYKQGISIPNSLKPPLHEFLGLNFNNTLTALFWATNILFIYDDEPQKITP